MDGTGAKGISMNVRHGFGKTLVVYKDRNIQESALCRCWAYWLRRHDFIVYVRRAFLLCAFLSVLFDFKLCSSLNTVS